jgi:conjugal transfer pilus assembly protein TraU
MTQWMRWLAGVVLWTASTVASAIGTPTCPNAGLWSGGIVSKVCWPCFFPIYMGPTPIGASTPRKPDDDVVPTCVCPGRVFGIPTPGLRLAMSQPTHLLEIVRQPYCSPAMGMGLTGAGITTGVAGASKWGGPGAVGQDATDHGAYYNYHYWFFPLAVVLDLLQDSVCVSDAGFDLDLAYMSELDPTHNNSELAMVTHPEAVLFSSPPAMAACVADAVAATTYKPLLPLFWCLGSWGYTYPLIGHTGKNGNAPRDASQVAGRALAALHRRGIALRTYGPAAVCRDHPDPILPKQQYKLQTMFPVPELVDNHWLGTSPYRWGAVTIPAVGEDFVYIVWSWQSCCANY